MKTPEIYADYHDVDDENRVFLTKVGTRQDLAKHGIELKEGLRVTIYMDDADDDGNSDDLMADAIVRYNEKKKCWVAQIDWSKVQNRSEREKALVRKSSHRVKNGAIDVATKSKPVRSAKPVNGRTKRKIAKKS